MLSWHQSKNPVALYHPELYTVVSSQGHSGVGVMRFPTHAEAQTNCDGLKKHHAGITAYILSPSKLIPIGRILK